MQSFLIRNSLLTLALAVLASVAGWWAWRTVPVDALPDLSDNQVIVWADWAGKSPDDIDLQVTLPLARELQGLAHVRTVRGLSLQGSSYVYVIFEDRSDPAAARARVLERLAQLRDRLPEGVRPVLGPDATAMGQVYGFTLQGSQDPEFRRRQLDQVVLPALRGLPGVAEVAPAGGVVREYQIDVDPNRLEEQGLTLEDIERAVRASGRDVAPMSVERSGIETMLRGRGFLRGLEDVENIVIRGDRMIGAGVRLGEIAQVSVGGAVRLGLLADETGEQAGAIVAMRTGEDPLAVIGAVRTRLDELKPALARDGLTAVPFYDRSQLIDETRETVVSALVESMITTVIVVLLFLLHARASLATAVSLPLGTLICFLAMRGAGVSANVMSLAGIAIAIGVMVDFGIIIVENTTQHLAQLRDRCRAEGREVPRSPFDPEITSAVETAAKEVTRPLLTSAATTIIGFMPLFALTDQAGRLFIPMALTKTLAIAGAALVGIVLVPVLCRLLLAPWQISRLGTLALAGVVAGFVFAWFAKDGIRLPMEHGRWTILLPGWLAGPVLAAIAAFAVWRFGREPIPDYETNPTSRALAVSYDWAYQHIIRHRIAFFTMLVLLAGTGYLTGLGWERLSTPLRKAMEVAGADLSTTRLDSRMREWFPGVGSSFLPPMDEGSLLFMPSVPAAAGLGETQRVMDIQNRAIASVPEVAGLMGKLGRAETALDPAPIGMIETVVLLKPYRDWPVHAITLPDGTMERRPRTLHEVRTVLEGIADLPGVAPSWLQPIETRVVMLSTGIRATVALQILGHDAAGMERFAEQAERVLRGTPGAAQVQMQREGGKPYAEVRLDPAKLARFGLSAEDVLASVDTALGGMELTRTFEGNSRYPVRLRYLRERRDDPDEMAQVLVGMAGDHGAIPLSLVLAKPQVMALETTEGGMSFAEFSNHLSRAERLQLTQLDPRRAEFVLPAGDATPAALAMPGAPRVASTRPSEDGFTYILGPMAVRSENGIRTQYVMFNTPDGAEVAVVESADRLLRDAIGDGRVELPQGTTWRWVGRYEQKINADRTLAWIVTASFFVMVVLIYVGTRSWLITAVIVGCNATVTTAGGFFLVWLWGAELTTAVQVGFLILLGVMFNDGILLGTFLQQSFKTPPRDLEDVRARVFEAGLRRRRAAVMTNATTLLALVPVLWSEGRGSELMQPMVLPIVGGMLFDIASLFSVPAAFSWWWERKVLKTQALTKASANPQETT